MITGRKNEISNEVMKMTTDTERIDQRKKDMLSDEITRQKRESLHKSIGLS